jgi:hypothetical protein
MAEAALVLTPLDARRRDQGNARPLRRRSDEGASHHPDRQCLPRSPDRRTDGGSIVGVCPRAGQKAEEENMMWAGLFAIASVFSFASCLAATVMQPDNS